VKLTQTWVIPWASRKAVQWAAVRNTVGAMRVPEQRRSGPGLSGS
jgi:hypothetical protein